MAQVNQGKYEVMTAQEVGIVAVITQSQGTKFIDPGKGSFTGKPLRVDRFVEEPLPSPFDPLTITLIFGDVGNDSMIETDFASSTGIEGAIRIEVGAGNRDAAAFDAFESGLQIGFQIKSIMPVASHNAGTRQNEAVTIRDGENVAGFCPFARLIGHTDSAFFGNCMGAVKVQVRAVKLILDKRQTMLPNLLKTTRRIPFLPVIVNGLPTDFFFSGWSGSAAMGSSDH